jgi:cytochrome c oxidase assembly protein subunit 15
MSGMKAGLYYPTWPDMHGEYFPNVLIDSNLWTRASVLGYEKGVVPAMVQFVHRNCAYLIFILSIIVFWKSTKGETPSHIRRPVRMLLLLVFLQVCLGILTIINCTGKIPLFYGVAHQAMAILLLSNLIYLQKKIHR